MRIPDLEFMISDYEDPLCIHCHKSVDKHELVPVYRQGHLVHHDFKCMGSGSYTEYGQHRTYYYE